jgi:single-stranded-DNA-specific exonuclease
MCLFLTDIGANVIVYIPSRLTDGYGLSIDAISTCIELHQPKLIISVDCGVNSRESVAYAMSQGIDFVVTDHHEPDQNVARPNALIDPKLGSNRKLDVLSGVGVALKLSQGLLEFGRSNYIKSALQGSWSDYIDIAAIGTIADVVPLVGDNRIIVKHGLANMPKSKSPGIRAMLKLIRADVETTTYDIAFKFGPRINAAGRMGKADNALQLLLTNDATMAADLTATLDSVNNERRMIEAEITKLACVMVDSLYNSPDNMVLVVTGHNWHPGVVGIVASRLVERYNRPALVLSISDAGIAKGSCRSIKQFDLLEGLTTCSDLLSRYGGHKQAAGLELPVANLDQFRTRLNAFAQQKLAGVDLTNYVEVDAIIKISDIGWNFFEQQRKLEPFGHCNSEPIWLIQAVTVVATRPLGIGHSKLTISDGLKQIDVVAFNLTEDEVPKCQLDMMVMIKCNTFRGSSNIQLQLVGLKRTPN